MALKSFFKNGLSNILRFDKPDGRFELLEREKGTPDKWSGWQESRRIESSSEAYAPLSAALDENEAVLRGIFRADINDDVIFRRFSIASSTPALLVYMSGMAQSDTISKYVMKPLMEMQSPNAREIAGLLNDAVRIAEIEIQSDIEKLKQAILDGETVLIVEGQAEAAVLETRGFEKRSVSTTENEQIVRGPKEGFTESLRTNITLVRRIIRSEDLIVNYRPTGGENNTGLALIYRDGVTNKNLVLEIKRRLASVGGKTIASTGVIEQLIEDDSFSPIPQTLSTERPDRVASFVMQGSVAILADGSPFALVLPITFSALMSSPEDIYMRRPLGTLLRVVRYIGAAVSLVLPGYFIAVTMYHQGLLSTEVLSTIIKSRQMVFEPLPFEMILLLFVFQLIREAGIRVPGSIGQAIGVIGGLILGQAAVSANLASTVILIIVAMSGLGNLCIPDYSTQVSASYFRLAFVIAAWLGGLLGFVSLFVLFIAYLSNLKSFGVPFLAPFAPKTYSKRPFILRGRIGRHYRAADYANTSSDEMENGMNPNA